MHTVIGRTENILQTNKYDFYKWQATSTYKWQATSTYKIHKQTAKNSNTHSTIYTAMKVEQ